MARRATETERTRYGVEWIIDRAQRPRAIGETVHAGITQAIWELTGCGS